MASAHEHPHAPHPPATALPTACCGGGCAAPAGPSVAPAAPGAGRHYRIPAMDCAVEEAEIRRLLEGRPGIHALAFALAERRLRLDADAAVADEAVQAIRGLGFEVQPWPEAADAAAAPPRSGWGQVLARPLAALGLAALAEALAVLAPDSPLAHATGLGVAAAAIGLAGLGVLRKGAAALRQGRLNINALMTVAVCGAFAIGQWPEAAMVMALYALAELIEARAVDRARDAIGGLLALAPLQATVQQADGRWLAVPVDTVAVGALVRVQPGERLPVDGVVREGRSAIDQAAVTGESLPLDKGPGDEVFAGTLNQGGLLVLQAGTRAADATLARIIRAVEQAQASRAPMQRFVDAFAARYTPAVFVLALALALGGPLLLGWPWLAALYKALVMLVIACPCALVISTPVTVVSGLAAAARRGVLVKGGEHLEQAARLRVVALDKTGTLTEGRPRLVAWAPLAPEADAARLQQLAAALASHSDHPVARAIAAGLAAADRPLTAVTAVTAVEALPGRGLQAELDGVPHVLGNHRLIEERGQCSAALEARLREHEAAGHTVSLLASAQGPLALFAVADALKPGARAAVAELQALGLHTVMLSGDNLRTAEAIARAAGIAEVQAPLLPTDKQAAVQALQARRGPTAMVGDGINDAPALAQATLGVAMGAAGTHVAVEAADVVVMNDELGRIAETVRLARRTRAVLWQNIALALGIKAVFMALAVSDHATMWMAVFADMGASLLVVGNGLRLLRAR